MGRTHRAGAVRAVPVLAAVLVSVLALAGCSSAVDEGQPTDAAPVRGGILKIAAAADAQPAFVMANRAGNWSWRRLVFESLVELDASSQPQPLLATSWSYDSSRTTLTLTLRDDATFHTGRKMTADDVVFTLQQVKDPKNASQLARVAANITAVTATKPNEVTITLGAPSDSMFDLLDLTPVVDKDTFAGLADGSKVIGTGPFLWSQWRPGASITLTRNTNYRDAERPYLDGVEVSIISDSTALQSALKGGAADLAIGMAQSDVALLKADARFARDNAGGVFYPLGIDVTMAPFNRKEARQALGYALDRERIRDQVFGGDAVLTDLWWTPDSPGYPKDLATRYSYDPAKARQMLADAGAAGAQVQVTYANLPVMRNLFEVVQNNLTEVGLKVQANALDTPEYDRRQVAGTLGQSFLLLHGMVGFSAATIVDAMPSIRAGNPSHFTDAQFDGLKANLQRSTEDTRAKALSDISAYMLDQAFSHVVVVAPQFHVRSTALRGMKVVTLGSVVLTDAYRAA
jgi:peptide/nickel transport system substrate-binding protein